ncbi:MAG: hypothetical protein JNL68_10265 [Burkholderiales bacterium]|nr:hypothetical protein [Burkholderiales bacterium]
MSVLTLTDDEIGELLRTPKLVQNPGSREREEGKHLRRDYRVVSEDGRHEFILFTRQSTVIRDGFSAGIRWRSKTGEEVILLRCNGSDHSHVNVLEREQFEAEFHVHKATEKYIVAGKRSEGRAEPTDAFRTLNGALHEVMRLANISGLNTRTDEEDLFD